MDPAPPQHHQIAAMATHPVMIRRSAQKMWEKEPPPSPMPYPQESHKSLTKRLEQWRYALTRMNPTKRKNVLLA